MCGVLATIKWQRLQKWPWTHLQCQILIPTNTGQQTYSPLKDSSPRRQKLKKDFRLSSLTATFTDIPSEGIGPIQGQPGGRSRPPGLLKWKCQMPPQQEESAWSKAKCVSDLREVLSKPFCQVLHARLKEHCSLVRNVWHDGFSCQEVEKSQTATKQGTSRNQVSYACNLKAKQTFSPLKAPGSLTGSAWSEVDGSFRDSYLVMKQHLLFQLHPTEFTRDDDAVLHRGEMAQAHQRV